MKKTLLVLQFYEGDKAQGKHLTELICALQRGMSQEAGVLLACRYDATIEDDWVYQVARKFNVDTHTGRRRAHGWPFGPNELWYDTIQWLYENKATGRFNQYDHALFLEPDDAPMCANWIEKIREGWAAADQPCYVMGHIHDYAAGQTHVNGNAVFSLDEKFLFSIVRKHGGAPGVGWDVEWSPHFFKWGTRNTPLIRNCYARNTLDEASFEFLRSQGCVMVHGVKDLSVLALTRKKALGSGSLR